LINKDENETNTQIIFKNKCRNIVKLIKSVKVVFGLGISDWVILQEYCNCKSLHSFLNINSSENPALPEKILTEKEISDYFYQLRFYF
jgi:serine/threonine protein kinase